MNVAGPKEPCVRPEHGIDVKNGQIKIKNVKNVKRDKNTKKTFVNVIKNITSS